MAITHIHPVSSSAYYTLNYVTANKTVEGTISGAEKAIDYIVADKEDDKIYYTMSRYLNGCTKNSVRDDFDAHIRECLGTSTGKKQSKTKTGKHYVAWHLIQSFKGFEISQHEANLIGVDLCQEIFPNFMSVVSTHTNTDDIHNHIVICAWDNDGKKWNNCNENYARIREASDRICEMWGVSVLWDTHSYKLQNVYDKQGQLIGRFEPTERKIRIAKERAAKRAVGDVGDYRNTAKYAHYKEKEQKVRENVKADIDNLLPHVGSYDELLNELRNIGYRIKDKKKNGDWLKHISFTPPMTDKGVRDYRLGDGIFYTREALTAYIDELSVISNNKEYNTQQQYFRKLSKIYADGITISHKNPSFLDSETHNIFRDTTLISIATHARSAIVRMKAILEFTERINRRIEKMYEYADRFTPVARGTRERGEIYRERNQSFGFLPKYIMIEDSNEDNLTVVEINRFQFNDSNGHKQTEARLKKSTKPQWNFDDYDYIGRVAFEQEKVVAYTKRKNKQYEQEIQPEPQPKTYEDFMFDIRAINYRGLLTKKEYATRLAREWNKEHGFVDGHRERERER